MMVASLCLLLVMASAADAEVVVDLATAYKIAKNQDQSFLEAKGAYAENIEYKSQYLAALLPQLALDANGCWAQRHNDTDVGSATVMCGGEFGANVQLQLRQSVLDLGKIATYHKGIAQRDNAVAALQAAHQDLIVNVVQVYLGALEKISQSQFAMSNAAWNQRILQIKQAEARVGEAARSDIAIAQAAYDTANAALIQAEMEVMDAREDLRYLLHRPIAALPVLNEQYPFDGISALTLPQMRQTAIQRNPDIKAAIANATVSAQELRANRFLYAPTLDLTAAYAGTIYTNTTGGGSEKSYGPGAYVHLTLPLFTGLATASKIRQARAKLQQTRAQEEDKRRTVSRELRKNYFELQAYVAKVKAGQSSVASHKIALQSIVASYNNGLSVLVDVLNQQQLLYKAQKDLVTDKFSYLTTLFSLRRHVGILSERDIETLNGYLLHD